MPMLQEALSVLNHHGTEWFHFPKFFGMGADSKFRHLFWRAVLRVLDKMPPVTLAFEEACHPCNGFSPNSEEGHSLYDHLVEVAISLKSVESLLLHCEAEGLLDSDQYLSQHPDSHWFTEFEILSLVAADTPNLIKWSSKWNIHDASIFREIKALAECKAPPLISQELEPALYEWYAVHLFAVPVNNVVAERQFNIASIYLDPNQSELSKQATHLFVENVLHEPDERYSLLEKIKGNHEASNSEFKVRVTEPVRNHIRHQMRMYADQITPMLLLQARANLRKLRENSSEAAPLTAKDLFPAKISARKTRDNHQEKIKKLQEEGRSTELQWVAARKKDQGRVEEQRSYKPVFFNDIWLKDKVPTLMMLAACKVRQWGAEMPLTNIPRECEMYVRFLPQIIEHMKKKDSTQQGQQRAQQQPAKLRKLPHWFAESTHTQQFPQRLTYTE